MKYIIETKTYRKGEPWPIAELKSELFTPEPLTEDQLIEKYGSMHHSGQHVRTMPTGKHYTRVTPVYRNTEGA